MATSDRTSNFLAGRDLACEVLTLRAIENYLSGESSIEAQHRGEHAQNNWVLPFLEKLKVHPELAEGFAAVLSDFLPECGGTYADLYAVLTPEEMFGSEEATHHG